MPGLSRSFIQRLSSISNNGETPSFSFIPSHTSEPRIIVAARTVEKERSRRLSTATLNQVVQEAVALKPPPRTRGGKRGRVYCCTEAAIRPPTFVFFFNDSKLFPEMYRRYMEKQLQSDAGFLGTPIRLLWQSRRKVEKGRGNDNEVGSDKALAIAT